VSHQPVVVIAGRPNVGKSTLFNRLTGSRRALVHDLPGVTRDRIVGEARRPGGGIVTLVDTGGLLMEDTDHFVPLIRAQAEGAIRGADAVLLLLDGNVGLIPEDRELARFLSELRTPVVVVVNKSDRRDVALQAHEFFALGLGEPVPVSAEHGHGLAELWEALEPHLGEPGAFEEDDAPAEDDGTVRVAIIGRPNVGKSSLLNLLVGESRSLVSEVPGTTRDTVDVLLEREEARYLLVDTAGIRRKGRTERGPEVLSVVMARRALERAQVCLVMVDVTEGVTRQDAHVAGYAWEAGRAVVLAFNKWDLITGDRGPARERLLDGAAQQMKFMRHAPAMFISALTGAGVHRLFEPVLEVHGSFVRQAQTSDLNRLLRAAWERNPPSVPGKKHPKLFYATQVRAGPPTFLLFTNVAGELHFSYQRYLDNILRDHYHLAGVPIRVIIKGREHEP